ncbi:MAG: acetate kinase [Mycoplasmatales bacterium]
MEKVLILNAGSSTVKFQLFNNETDAVLASGVVDRIGIPGSYAEIKIEDKKVKQEQDFKNHKEGIELVLQMLIENNVMNSLAEIIKVGHRVVQGAEEFKEPTLVQPDTLQKIKDLAALAPLHNLPNAQGIEVIQELLPNVKNILSFDTEFHQTIPQESYLYATPMSWYTDYKVRRYGMHGISHKYVSNKSAELRGVKVDEQSVIVCHLGNGASLSAVKNGKCIQTSMGLTPLEGVVMGTRSGDIDPAIIEYMCKQTGKTVEEITHELNFESGIKGISGISSDFRDIKEAMDKGDERAKIAMKIYITRLVEYIGSYYFRLGGVDAIIFTAGIGENSRDVRKLLVKELAFLGIKLDEKANEENELFISTKDSQVDVMIIPTNEEYQILQETKKF